ATGSEDRIAQVWHTRMDEMADAICAAVTDRTLTREEWDQHVGGDFDYDAEYARCAGSGVSPPVTARSILRDTTEQGSRSHE
ncbi:MAG: hypothetical protein R3178_08645, partial [Rhodothermales bacterium]|nr:hypothetical protein [Rhodothermales bacterium]